MKLRNKKTGDIIESEYMMLVQITSTKGERNLLFENLTKLNEEWEDYKPIKPLIKDEKIRKAVRAWAEANGLNYANCYESAHAWYLRAFNSREQGIDIDIEFWGYQLPKELKDCETYTITELCGEEEE